MNNLKFFKQFINEGWFSKKTNIEKVQDEEININDFDKIKNNIDKDLDNFIKYKADYFNYLGFDESLVIRYYDKAINELFKCTINLYRLVKMYIKHKDKITITKNELDYYKGNIFKYYDHIKMFYSDRKKILENIYFLNKISFLLDNINKRFIVKKMMKI